MTAAHDTTSPSTYRDRKTGLVVFGVVLFLLGGLCALLVPVGFLPVALNQPGASWRMTLGSASLYMLLAVGFAWLGIGSILAKRWARILILMLAWIWLICGVVTAAVLVFLLPSMAKWMMLSGDFGSDVETLYPIVVATMFVTVGVFYIALPGLLVLFYRGKNVRATCEARDPRLSWTEKRPRAVVVLSLTHAVMAYFFIFNGFVYNWTVPLFGAIAGGWVGAVLLLASTGLSVYLTPALYEQRPAAWWTAVGLAAVWTTSSAVTFLRVPIVDYYHAMGIPPESLEVLVLLGDLTWLTVLSIVLLGGAYFAYLAYAKRFYRGP